MSPLLMPILAQAVSVLMGDRTEFRRVADSSRDDLELETLPNAGLAVTGQRYSLAAGYSPTLTLAPLERDTQFDFLHAVNGVTAVSFGSTRTTYSLSATGVWAERNYRRLLLAGQQGSAAPLPGAAPPVTGAQAAAQTLPAADTIVRVGDARGLASVSHGLSPVTTFIAAGGYQVSGGLDEGSRALFPVIHGPDLTLTLSNLLTPRDTLQSSVVGRYTWASNQVRTLLIGVTEGLAHVFSPTTTGDIGAGVSFSSNKTEGSPASTQIMPTGSAGLANNVRFARGMLQSRVSIQFAPVLDRASARVDNRFSSAGGLMWTRDRFTASANAQGTTSLTPSATGAAESWTADATIAFDLGKGFTTDAGARVTKQETQGAVAIPFSQTLFVGVSWREQVPLTKQSAVTPPPGGAISTP